MKKKFLVGLLAIVMCFALVGCGKTESNNGGSNNGGSNNGGSTATERNYKELDKITKDNYVSYVEKFGDITFKVPSGWEIDKIEKQTGSGVYDASIRLYFTQPVDKADIEQYANDLIAECGKTTKATKEQQEKAGVTLADRWNTYDYSLASHNTTASAYQWSYLVLSHTGFEEVQVTVATATGMTEFTFTDWDKFGK